MSFSPFDALKFCIIEEQERSLLENILKELEAYDDGVAPGGESLVEEDHNLRLLNSINIKPKFIEVKESNLWKKKDLSKVKDLTTIE